MNEFERIWVSEYFTVKRRLTLDLWNEVKFLELDRTLRIVDEGRLESFPQKSCRRRRHDVLQPKNVKYVIGTCFLRNTNNITLHFYYLHKFEKGNIKLF